MNIDRVTITGTDDKVDPIELRELSILFPFVEWGILFSTNKGRQRYPSDEWINEIQKIDGINLSAHFCGWYSKEVLENENFDLITNLSDNFNRVQLNYNFSYNTKWKLNSLKNYTKLYDLRNIILQYNKSNSKFLDLLMDEDLPSNINFLYDSSGGRGTHIQDIKTPFKNYTGYAGGIGLENIETICDTITKSTNSNETVWIDLESGARTDNEFDIEKVKFILATTAKFLRK